MAYPQRGRVVVGFIGEIDVRIDWSGRLHSLDFRLEHDFLFSLTIIGEVKRADGIMLRLVGPQRGGHGAEVGKRPAGFGSDVIRRDAVRLRDAAGEVIVGYEELDGGELFEWREAPILIEVQNGETAFRVGVEQQRKECFAIAAVFRIEVRLFAVAVEVLRDFDGHGEEFFLFVQHGGAFEAARLSADAEIDVAIMAVCLDVHRQFVMLLRDFVVGFVEACAAQIEIICSFQFIVAEEFAAILPVEDLDGIGIQWIAFTEGCFCQFCEIV